MYGLDQAWLDAACSLAPPAQAGAPPTHEALLAPGYAPPASLAAPLGEAQRAGLREKLASAWRWGENAEVGAPGAVGAAPLALACRPCTDWPSQLCACLCGAC